MRNALRQVGLVLVILLIRSVGMVCAGEAAPALVDVFTGKQDGFPIYRIPSVVVTKSGTVLAFAEGRAKLADHSQNKIVLKRSGDGGATWGPLQVIADAGKDCLNNPCALVLADTGRVLLMYQRYPEAHDEKTAIAGTSGDLTCLTFLITSDDDGGTWSSPRDITAQVKPPTATSMASGPGVGIQLRRGQHPGRIIFPFNHGPLKTCENYAAYSDDGGVTWAYGKVARVGSAGHGDEVQMVELTDGRLMLNSRSRSAPPSRRVAFSSDAGQTWSTLAEEPQLIEPRCMASIIRYSDPGATAPGRLLFSNPASASNREKGTLYTSADEGKSWSVVQVIYPGSFAYSCLAVLPDGSIGCLFERDGYTKISFARISVNQ